MMRLGTTCGGVAAVGLFVILSLMASVPLSQAQLTEADQIFAPVCIPNLTNLGPIAGTPKAVCGNVCHFGAAATATGRCVIQCPRGYGIMTEPSSGNVCFVPTGAGTAGVVPATLPSPGNGCRTLELTPTLNNPMNGATWPLETERVTLQLARDASLGTVSESWVFCKRHTTAFTGTYPNDVVTVAPTEFNYGSTTALIGIKIVISATRPQTEPIVAGLLKRDLVLGVCVGDDCIPQVTQCPPCPGFVSFCPT